MAKDFWESNREYDRNSTNYDDNYVQLDESGAVMGDKSMGSFMAGVFGWMFFGILITAAAAFAFILGIYTSPFVQQLASSSAFFMSIVIAELVAVFSISLGLRKMGAGTARLLFMLYAALNGITLSYIFLVYTGSSVVLALAMTSVFFGVMAVYGYTTKSDLSKFGPILFSALISIIIATVVNMFLRSPMMEYVISLVGIGVFAGLTAYDVKKLKGIYYSMASQGGEMASKISIIGALTLYLDFVNMFIFLLRLVGKKK